MTISRSPPQAVAEGEGTDGASSSTSECLTTDEILELLLGALPEAKRDRAVEHVASCFDCRVLFGGAAQALEDTGPVAVPSHGGIFRVGMLVAHRYRVERFVARGGMGEVYAVRDEMLSEAVALKTVRSRSTDGKAMQRLKSEALLSRRIGHPNTCRIFEFGEHESSDGDTICFLTMELVQGETLGARLRRQGALPSDLVSTVLRQVLGGLAEAHGLGIVHRDLKSENIMLREPTSAGLAIDAVVMDFGLALRVDADERLTSDSHALIGSAAYMAPEQVEGGRLTPATDIYALGVILFEMLTGELPFRSTTPVSTALQRLHQPPPAPSSVRPELDRCWDRVVLGCLQRAVEQRFTSVKDVLAALERPEAPAPAISEQRPRRFSSGALVLGAGALVVGVLLTLGAAVRSRPDPPRSMVESTPRVAWTPSVRPESKTEASVAIPPPPVTAPREASPPPLPAVSAPPNTTAPRPAAAPRRVPQRHRARSDALASDGSSAEASPSTAHAPDSTAGAAPKHAMDEQPAAPKALAGQRAPLVASPLDPLPLDPELPE